LRTTKHHPRASALLYPITEDGPVDATWWRRFEAGLAKGYTLLQLRIRNEPVGRWRTIAEQAAGICGAVGCEVMLNLPTVNDPVRNDKATNTRGLSQAVAWVEEFDFAGIHLPASALMGLEDNPFAQVHAGKRRLLAASCHCPEELQHAERIGADWVCLSPVRPTSSHPGAPALGMETFRDWTSACRLPVYGLGGLSPEDLDLIRAAGGQGVAGISAFWG